MNSLLEYLITEKRIDSEFVDAWGKRAKIKRDSQKKLLSAMGYCVDDEQKLKAQLEAEAIEYWLNPLQAVFVHRINTSMKISVRVSIEQASQIHSLRMKFENGKTSSAKTNVKFTPVDHHLVASQEIDGIEYQEYEILLPQNAFGMQTNKDEAIGYHELQLVLGRKIVAKSRFILAPQTCYIPDNIKEGKKIWGLSVQLYCLRSKRNWGIGDFTDLKYLIEKAAQVGADFIGLNPIHSLFPSHPELCSPYGPSSRQWLNYLYIDVTQVPGFMSDTVQQWIDNNDIHQKLAQLRKLDFVDYEGVAHIKHKVLALCFDVFSSTDLAADNDQCKAFRTFVENGGDSLHTLAVFEALQTSLKQDGHESWGWPAFPQNLQSADSTAVTKFAKQNSHLVDFYKWLQWQAALQYESASKVSDMVGMSIGLYRDLAVGVSEGSAEIWGNKDLYCSNVSIGAPPDVLGPLGQKWGLPPIQVDELISQQYQPIIDLFSANMHASGALRIDHVMSLLRLWWVAKEDDASDGAYVNYPVDDLLAILTLESQRNKCLVIGEDLGTVPDSIREKLSANGMFSYRVFFFEQAEDGGYYSPSHYPEQSMATLTTHDMPTLIGFWHCDDLNLGKELGLYPNDEVLGDLYTSRHESKQAILDSLHGHQALSEDISRDVSFVGMTQSLNFAMQTHMATGTSALLSLQLEDWLQMEKPVNIPGTYDEYPNWRRKLSHDIEDIFAKSEIVDLANELTRKRQQASE